MRMPIILSACIILAAAAANAQYSGPGGTAQQPTGPQPPVAGATGQQVVTVGSITANPQDDQQVVVEGMLVRKLDKENYLLSDGSGEIIVEIDDDKFPNGQVDDKTKVRIEGEVDVSSTKPTKIDANRVTVVP